MRLPGVLVKKGGGVCSRLILEKRRRERERERIREKGGEAGAGADAEAGCGVKCTFLYIWQISTALSFQVFSIPGPPGLENGALKKRCHVLIGNICMYV